MTRTLRIFSVAGPCLTRANGGGPIVGETPKFWITQIKGLAPRRVAKARDDVHIEPCSCCTDHPRSQYPDGYMD